MSAPFSVAAKFPYTPEAENATDDLPFSIGQKITVTEVVDDDWYYGTYTDSKGDLLSGYFPKSFVEPVSEDVKSAPAASHSTAHAASTAPIPIEKDEEPEEPKSESKPELQEEPAEVEESKAQGNSFSSIPHPTSTQAEKAEEDKEDKEAHMLAFKNKLKSFDVESAAPPLPFNKTPVEPSYVKKSFSGASPHSNYVPPPFFKSPQEQKVVPVKVERPADVVSENTDVHHDEEEAPKLTLKQRMQMLEAGRKEEEAALAAALKRKAEKKAAKKHAAVEGNTTGGSIASNTSTNSGSGSYSHSQAHFNRTGDSIAEGEENANEDHFVDAQETQGRKSIGDIEQSGEVLDTADYKGDGSEGEEDEEEEQDDDEGEDVDDDDEEEEEEDDEEEKKRQLRERMAKLSGGMGMMGMMGFGMPAPSKTSTTKTKTKKKKKEVEESKNEEPYANVPAAIPILPFASGAPLPPALAKPAKAESEDEALEEDEPETPQFSDVKPVESAEEADIEAEEKAHSTSEYTGDELEKKETIVEEPTQKDFKDNSNVTAVPSISSSAPVASTEADSHAGTQSIPKVPDSEVVDEYIDSSEEEIDGDEEFERLPNEKEIHILNNVKTDTEEDAGTTTGYEADEDSNIASTEKFYTSPVKPILVQSPNKSAIAPDGGRFPSQPQSHAPPPPPPPSAPVPSVPPQIPQSPVSRTVPSIPPPPPAPAPVPQVTHSQAPQLPTERPAPPIPSAIPPVPSSTTRDSVSSHTHAPPPPPPSIPAPTPSSGSRTYHAPPPPPPPISTTTPHTISSPTSTSIPPPIPSPTNQLHSSVAKRRSMEVQQPLQTTTTGTIVPDIASPQFSHPWWLNNEVPQEFSGKDLYFEVESHDIVKRGNRTVRYVDYYIVNMDYSQKVWELSYDISEPSKLLSFHETQLPAPVPSNISKNYLIDASKQYGARAIQLASSVIGSPLKEDLISWTLSQIPSVLPKVGSKTFGATIYRNNNNTEISTIDEFRPGDILVVVKGKFESSGAFHKKSYELGTKTGSPYVAIISSFDQTKKKIRVIEQSSSKGIHNNGYRLEDMKSGRVRVFRLVGRDYVGW